MNDVLVLMKQQKLAEMEKRESLDFHLQARQEWYTGLGVGAVIVMMLFSGATYLHLVNPQMLATIGLTAAISGGVIVFLNRMKRN